MCLIVLVGMALLLREQILVDAVRQGCGRNQKQLVLAMISYRNENAGWWPVRPSGTDGGMDASCPARPTAAGSLELLAKYCEDRLVKGHFRCAGCLSWGPAIPQAVLAESATVSQWAAADSTGVGCMPYAYDWTVPRNASATRVVLADRGHSHKTGVMAAFADGHFAWIAASLPTAAATMPIAPGFIFNKDADHDDLFSDVGDGTAPPYDQRAIGVGSSTRAWLR